MILEVKWAGEENGGEWRFFRDPYNLVRTSFRLGGDASADGTRLPNAAPITIATPTPTLPARLRWSTVTTAANLLLLNINSLENTLHVGQISISIGIGVDSKAEASFSLRVGENWICRCVDIRNDSPGYYSEYGIPHNRLGKHPPR